MQKAAAPRNGVEFRQIIISDIKCSLTTLYDDWGRRGTLMKLTGTGRQTGGQAERTRY